MHGSTHPLAISVQQKFQMCQSCQVKTRWSRYAHWKLVENLYDLASPGDSQLTAYINWSCWNKCYIATKTGTHTFGLEVHSFGSTCSQLYWSVWGDLTAKTVQVLLQFLMSWCLKMVFIFVHAHVFNKIVLWGL